MGKYAVIIGLLLLFVSLEARGEVVDLRDSGMPRSDWLERQDEDACDCCQKCKAARRPIQPEEQELPAEKNGCEDCCKRCGRPMPPAPEEIPPEIIKDTPAR